MSDTVAGTPPLRLSVSQVRVAASCPRKGAATSSFLGRWPGQAADREGVSFRSRALFSWHEAAWGPDRLEAEMVDDPLRQHFQPLTGG